MTRAQRLPPYPALCMAFRASRVTRVAVLINGRSCSRPEPRMSRVDCESADEVLCRRALQRQAVSPSRRCRMWFPASRYCAVHVPQYKGTVRDEGTLVRDAAPCTVVRMKSVRCRLQQVHSAMSLSSQGAVQDHSVEMYCTGHGVHADWTNEYRS